MKLSVREILCIMPMNLRYFKTTKIYFEIKLIYSRDKINLNGTKISLKSSKIILIPSHQIIRDVCYFTQSVLVVEYIPLYHKSWSTLKIECQRFIINI